MTHAPIRPRLGVMPFIAYSDAVLVMSRSGMVYTSPYPSLGLTMSRSGMVYKSLPESGSNHIPVRDGV